jgi:enoyl-CoA hydratase
MQTTTRDTVIYEKDGAVARAILNLPEKANAMTSQMVWDFEETLKEAEADYDVKVLVIKANGKGFSAGHYLNPNDPYPEFKEGFERVGHNWKAQADLFLWPVLHLWEFQKPTIAQVHGYAVGGGSYWALLPDITIASEDAYFPMPLVQGFGRPGAETGIEPWIFMNWKRTFEYMYTSQTLSAAEAHEMGLVNKVVPRAALESTVEELAARIARAPLTTLMTTKTLVKRAWELMGFRTHMQMSTDLMHIAASAGDVKAFLAEMQGRRPRQVAEDRLDDVVGPAQS